MDNLSVEFQTKESVMYYVYHKHISTDISKVDGLIYSYFLCFQKMAIIHSVTALGHQMALFICYICYLLNFVNLTLSVSGTIIKF